MPEYDKLDKYAKLAVLASISEPKSLSELGIFWFNENGRFYKKKAKEGIADAIKKNILLKHETKYKANTPKIVSSVYSEIKDQKLKEQLDRFWSHEFSQRTYLCPEVINIMFQNNSEKAVKTKINTILNTPLILHKLQEKDIEIYSLFVSMQNLEEYTTMLNIKCENNLSINFRNLKDKTDRVNNLNKIIKNNKCFIKGTCMKLKTKKIIRGLK